MNARPLVLLGESDLLRVRQAAAQALEEWRTVWGLGARATQVACMVSSIREALFGRSEPGAPESDAPVALEVGDLAIDDLIGRVLGKGALPVVRKGAGDPAPEFPAEVFEQGSGALVLDIEIHEGRFRVVAGCGTTQASPAKQARTGTQPPGESHVALLALPVTLEAELGELELDLATLQSLEAGDVVRLTTRIDQPLRLCAPGGSTVCFGDFGTQEGFRALSLRKQLAHDGA